MSKEKRPCDVCGYIEELTVCCSSIGGMSFGYCSTCLLLGAEPKGYLGDYLTFNIDTGKYEEDGKDVPIMLKNGMEFKTRKKYEAYKKDKI